MGNDGFQGPNHHLFPGSDFQVPAVSCGSRRSMCERSISRVEKTHFQLDLESIIISFFFEVDPDTNFQDTIEKFAKILGVERFFSAIAVVCIFFAVLLCLEAPISAASADQRKGRAGAEKSAMKRIAWAMYHIVDRMYLMELLFFSEGPRYRFGIF